jgi:hypothetical protein
LEDFFAAGFAVVVFAAGFLATDFAAVFGAAFAGSAFEDADFSFLAGLVSAVFVTVFAAGLAVVFSSLAVFLADLAGDSFVDSAAFALLLGAGVDFSVVTCWLAPLDSIV